MSVKEILEISELISSFTSPLAVFVIWLGVRKISTISRDIEELNHKIVEVITNSVNQKERVNRIESRVERLENK